MELTELIEQLERIQAILKESPEVLEALKLCNSTQNMVIPVKAEPLVEIKQATQLLKVSRNLVMDYTKQGILPTYNVPGSRNRKYKLSDVMSLAKKEESK